MIATKPEADLHSINDLCAQFGCLPGKIERAAVKVGIAPALKIDGRPYFDDPGAEKIRQHLQTKAAE